MASLRHLSLLLTLPAIVAGSWFPRRNAPTGCAFTISSSGSFACPAGQLPDGQIRLNGSEPTATFYLGADGGITDSNGFGCIVTDPPTTQVQCDAGKPPMSGFSIDASNILMYKGSPNFWACPATDTEYNVYVNPEFGQSKCFAIILMASGNCGAAPTCPPASTVWTTAMQTVTDVSTQTVTVVVTDSTTCSATPTSSAGWNSSGPSTICHKCSKESDMPTATPVPQTSVAKRGFYDHLLNTGLVKRDLEDDWKYTQSHYLTDPASYKWVPTGQITYFPLTIGQTFWTGTELFTSCTLFVVVGPKGYYFGHIRQIMPGGDSNCPLDNGLDTSTILIPYINNALSSTDWTNVADQICDRFVWIMGTVMDNTEGGGPDELKQYFYKDEEGGTPAALPQNVKYFYYTPMSPFQGEDGTARGKGLVKWNSVTGGTGNGDQSTLEVYFSNDTPRIVLRVTNDDQREVTFQQTQSDKTTDGTKVYIM